MHHRLVDYLRKELRKLRTEGLYKRKRVITCKQAGAIEVASGDQLLNFCANNRLRLANSPELADSAKSALDGYGMASVLFIRVTQEGHKAPESPFARSPGLEDTILHASCFDANAGLFEALLGAEDTVISDTLNHASTIDGIRLCEARRSRYRNNDMMVDGCDVVLELTGAAPAFHHMIKVRNNGGKIAIPGVAPTASEIHWSKVIFEMLNLKGINGRGVFETWHRMTTFLQGGFDFSGIVTHWPGATDVRDGM